MNIRKVIDKYFDKNASALAREFGVTHTSVWKWEHVGMTPQREAQIRLWVMERSKRDARRAKRH